METLPDLIELGPEEEGRRVWSAALAARISAPTDLVDLCSAIDLGLRAVEILVVFRLQRAKDQFPATIAAQLETPHPEVDTQRDAINVPSTLTFTDVLDLLSADELECVSPGMHRGWEDRRFSCRRSRTTAQETLGITLDSADRENLLVLSSYRNRLTRYPPPIRIEPHRILDAFDTLVPVVEKLLVG
jgi:hypothetical protein